ncbi:MAG: T9SS type A sorting domain-containing protein, partial [Bacteroidia bacterium]|nr:T9SS type A sorting domain-containing protein [Bacteroidia bacterium]
EVSLTALRGNEYDFIMGSYFEGSEKAQFYNGRINDFKYWKQKLSGQDVLFLHFPEKEFEVKQEFFLTCCEQMVIGEDITIDINNPLDSLIVPNASPTGYDSTYIYGFIQNDPSPTVNESMIPDDIVVSYQQLCQEFCEASATWNISPEEIFSDNCNALEFSQSHFSPVLLDENISFIEVVYTASDDCGQKNSFTLNLELECLPSEAVTIPEQNEFITEVNASCVDVETDAICKFSDIKLFPGFINEASQLFEAYGESSTLILSLSVNGASRQVEISEILEGIELPELKEEGSYQVCFESISNECQTNDVNFCKSIIITGSSSIDHGTIVACPSSLEETLPQDISNDLKTLILNNPLETRIEISYEDDCSCIVQEGIKIEFATDESPEEVVLEACPDEFPLTVLDLEIMESDVYEQTLLYFDNASYSSDANGSACDSSVLLTVIKKPIFEEFVNAEICEGEVFESYAETGQYEDVFVAENGCDSIRTLSLEVLPKSYEDIFVEICPDSTYMGYSEEGTYEILETNVLGCDSITTLNLMVLDESDPACMVSNLNENLKNIEVYPNPTLDVINVQLPIEEQNMYSLEIVNVQGKKVRSFNKLERIVNISNLETGIYYLRMLKNNNVVFGKAIIKM